MALSFSRPDPSSPDAVASATFSTTRRGFDQNEVRDLLRMVAAEMARLQERERFLERELRSAQRGSTNAAVALDEEVVTRMLGEEAARILSTAREAASQIKIRSEDAGARMLREATDEAQRLREEAEVEAARRRQDASADAESELVMAKQQGREMVNEARAYRERVLSELARRRELARQQIEQLMHGRDRLLQAFERSRLVAVDVMAELTPLGEPSEYVNLSPTTGPVPLMVPNQRPPREPLDAPLVPIAVETGND
ncbi:MAG: DivIVA domain-containing protein, partial [Ilumatobacteraceae bacterium]